jgi:excisionase family DNA binding protein
MTQNLVEKTFCTTSEAADLLGVSVGTVQLWVESGLLAAWKTSGGHRRIQRESVQKLLHKPHPISAPANPSAAAGTYTSNPVPIDSASDSAPRRLRVLVLEDDPDLLMLYKIKLSSWPMQPEIAGVPSAVSALISIGRCAPDLLIADMRMAGGLDGFDMLRQMHKTPEMANTTIVVVTGLDVADIEARGGIPANIEVLSKPVPFQRLQDIAQSIVSKTPTITH